MLKQLENILRDKTFRMALRSKDDNDRCWVSDCPDIGLSIGYIRSRDLFVWACHAHMGKLLHEDNPEYFVDCPACGCEFGVN